jgi:hypothetical protein
VETGRVRIDPLRRIAPALAACLAGCALTGGGDDAPPKTILQSGRPFQVTAVVERGPYLDALLARGGEPWRFFFPPSEDCRALIRTENVVEWHVEGHYGEARQGGRTCTPAGIGDLARWRDRGPREFDRSPIPRGTARFRVVYEDEEWVLARGRFPFANRVGWPNGADAVAAIPNTEVCRPLIARGEASLEYRPNGPNPYRLVTGAGLCPVEGFLRPLP